MKNLRLEPEIREAVLLTAAVELANKHGLVEVTHEAVAKRVKPSCNKRTVERYFPRNKGLWLAIARDHRAELHVRQQAEGMGIK